MEPTTTIGLASFILGVIAGACLVYAIDRPRKGPR